MTYRYGAAMRTRSLGQLEVSVVGLGCNNFGGRIDEASTRAVVDAALDAGVTFFDTADVYGDGGGSETILGQRAAGPARPRRARDEVREATWATAPSGAARATYIRRAIEASLRRLQTDVIDLYQYHQPDPVTPLEETLGALDELVDEGKVRAFGTSNYAPETLAARQARSPAAAFVSEQSEYSWLERDAEDELLPACERARARLHPVLPARDAAC